MTNNGIPFYIYKWASGEFLTESLPDEATWDSMSDDEQDAFLLDHVTDELEYHSASQVWDKIDCLAFSALTLCNFFKSKTSDNQLNPISYDDRQLELPL